MSDIERVQIRCLLVGPPAVGKSTFVKKLTNGNVNQDYSMTSRVSIHRKSYVQSTGRLQMEVAFLDCPGKEVYQQLVEHLWKRAGSKCVVVAVFDVTNRASIAPVESFLGSLNKQSSKSIEQSGILVANKIDLVDKRIVSPAEGQQKAKMLKLRYFECSALNDSVVQEFDQLLADLAQTSLSSSSELERNGPNQPAVAVKALDSIN